MSKTVTQTVQKTKSLGVFSDSGDESDRKMGAMMKKKRKREHKEAPPKAAKAQKARPSGSVENGARGKRKAEVQERMKSNQRLRKISAMRVSRRSKAKKLVKEHRSTSKHFNAMRMAPFREWVNQIVAEEAEKMGMKIREVGTGNKNGAVKVRTGAVSGVPKVGPGAADVLRNLAEKDAVSTMDWAMKLKHHRGENLLQANKKDFLLAQVVKSNNGVGPEYKWEGVKGGF